MSHCFDHALNGEPATDRARSLSLVRHLPHLAHTLLVAFALLITDCGEKESTNTGVLGGKPKVASENIRHEIEGRIKLPDSTDHSGIQVFVPGGSWMAMTDTGGRFTLENLKPGVHSLIAQKAGYKSLNIGDVEIFVDDESKRFVLPEVVLERDSRSAFAQAPPRAQGSIQGLVSLPPNTDPGLIDLSGALIQLQGTPMRTVTDDAGSFLFWNLEPGIYTLVADYPGSQTYTREIEVAAGRTTDLTIAIEDLIKPVGDRTIKGLVELVLTDGTVVENDGRVQVVIAERPGLQVDVNAEGRFTLDGLPPAVYTFNVIAEGFVLPAPVAVDMTDVTYSDVVLTLAETAAPMAAPGAIVGFAVRNIPDADNAGIQVAVTGTSFVAVTASDGSYRIDGVPPGVYSLLAQAPDFENATAEVEVIEATEITAPDLFLEPLYEYPEVIATDPANGFSGLRVEPKIVMTFRFNKKMKPETLRAAVEITPALDYQVFGAREHPRSDFDLMVIEINGMSLEPPVQFDTKYRLEISTAAQDVEGLFMQEDFRYDFRTGEAEIIATRPADGSKGATLSPGNPVIVEFNARLAEDAVDARDIRIRPSVGGTPNVVRLDDARTGWTQIQIQATWAYDTEYKITMPRRIRTASGQYVANAPYDFEFRTNEVSVLPGYQTQR